MEMMVKIITLFRLFSTISTAERISHVGENAAVDVAISICLLVSVMTSSGRSSSSDTMEGRGGAGLSFSAAICSIWEMW